MLDSSIITDLSMLEDSKEERLGLIGVGGAIGDNKSADGSVKSPLPDMIETINVFRQG